MNANEIADELEMVMDGYAIAITASGMLRQQQAEIEALKKEAALQRLSDFTQEAESFDRTASHMAGEYVSYKAELTDEEIRTIQAICHLKNVGYDNFIMRFARAILRKAQEKWA